MTTLLTVLKCLGLFMLFVNIFLMAMFALAVYYGDEDIRGDG